MNTSVSIVYKWTESTAYQHVMQFATNCLFILYSFILLTFIHLLPPHPPAPSPRSSSHRERAVGARIRRNNWNSLAIIDSSVLSICSSYSSSAASALVHPPLSVLMSSCTSSSAPLLPSNLTPFLSSFCSHFHHSHQVSPILPSEQKFSHRASSSARCSSYYFSSNNGTLHHYHHHHKNNNNQWLPVSILHILARHRRRRRSFSSFYLSSSIIPPLPQRW